ncbi:acylphosphatase [Thomasclavelia sp.]|uniref:acylphosphatase n=1 Tax=Thomasclavelia sp. TaxID=3025757 RepID=UPI0025F9E6D9|nr:acylphosphatase [Thomasclavelia sp.]
MIRRHYIFKGRVQGVGFRFTTYQKALQLGLTGWVRNLYDGTVEACFQGEEVKIDRLVKEMQAIRYIRIDAMEIEELSVDPLEKAFNMVH